MSNINKDDARDFSIRIIEHLICKLGWDEPTLPESEWYPFDLQDEITNILCNDDTCPECDQHPYSDIDSMCPVCGKLIIDHNKTSAVSCNTVYDIKKMNEAIKKTPEYKRGKSIIQSIGYKGEE